MLLFLGLHCMFLGKEYYHHHMNHSTVIGIDLGSKRMRSRRSRDIVDVIVFEILHVTSYIPIAYIRITVD